jgi:hypothetical protein
MDSEVFVHRVPCTPDLVNSVNRDLKCTLSNPVNTYRISTVLVLSEYLTPTAQLWNGFGMHNGHLNGLELRVMRP